MEQFFGSFISIFNLFADWVRTLLTLNDNGVTISWGWFILTAVILAALFFSAAFSADRAEALGNNPGRHLWLGLMLPGLYPALALKTLKPQFGEDAEAARKPDHAVAPPPKLKASGLQFKSAAEAENTEDPENTPEDAEIEQLDPDHEITKNYLMEIAIRPNGTAAGPFIFTLTDGSNLNILRILNPMEAVAVLEVKGMSKEGDELTTLRLPYQRIRTIQYKL